MRHSRKGITLAELVVSIGIIGVLSFLLPILVRLFNTLAYLQQKSLLQKEAKAVLWQMSHEMANAVRVDVAPPHGEDCVNAVDANADCMRIWTYDFQKYYDSGKYELPAMYGPSPMDHLSAKARYGRIMYEVVSETTADINGNGRIDTKPYLLKRVIWPAAWGPRPVVSSTQTFFSGRIVKTTTPYPAGSSEVATFAIHGGGSQLVKVTFKLKSSYDRPTDPPRYYSSVVTMDSLPVKWIIP